MKYALFFLVLFSFVARFIKKLYIFVVLIVCSFTTIFNFNTAQAALFSPSGQIISTLSDAVYNYDMKLIPLSQSVNYKYKILNLSAQVDDDDFDRVNQFKWSLSKSVSGEWYAHRRNLKGLVPTKISLHRFVMNEYDKTILIDHRDRNPLNCQKHNLRRCNRSQNMANRRPVNGKYLGVYVQKNRFVASIRKNKRLIYIGSFLTIEEAAKAYDKKAIELHGEFANLNFK